MSKNHNMGRKSQIAQDSEQDMNRPSADATEETAQTMRPTQHPAQGTKASGEAHLRHHSRRGS